MVLVVVVMVLLLLLDNRWQLTRSTDRASVVHGRRVDRIHEMKVLRRVDWLTVFLQMRPRSLQMIHFGRHTTPDRTFLKVSLEDVAARKRVFA